MDRWPVLTAGLSKIAIASGKAPAKCQAGSYEHQYCSGVQQNLFNHNGNGLVVMAFTAKGRVKRPWRFFSLRANLPRNAETARYLTVLQLLQRRASPAVSRRTQSTHYPNQ
jgi:hypothetical protein